MRTKAALAAYKARRTGADIARRIGMSVPTVKRVLRRLESLELVAVAYRGGLSVYRVHPLGSKL